MGEYRPPGWKRAVLWYVVISSSLVGLVSFAVTFRSVAMTPLAVILDGGYLLLLLVAALLLRRRPSHA
jgi:hypothetical protein